MEIATEQTRQRAIAAYEAGEGAQAQIARAYRDHLSTFQRWLQRYRQTGQTAPLPRGHRPAVYEGEELRALDKAIKSRPDATLDQLRAQTGKSCSLMAVHRAVARLGYRFKKSRYEPASRTDPM